MKAITRWMTAALAAVLTASLSIGPGLAAPPAEPFADFRIDAASMDVPDRDISVCLCQRDSGGAFQADGVQEYSCKLNRVTEDASFTSSPGQTASGSRWTTSPMSMATASMSCWTEAAPRYGT